MFEAAEPDIVTQLENSDFILKANGETLTDVNWGMTQLNLHFTKITDKGCPGDSCFDRKKGNMTSKFSYNAKSP